MKWWTQVAKLTALAASISLPTPAQAQILMGPAHVVDGDTLDIGDTRIRLLGLDAMELEQTCRRDGQEWACGQEARDQLQSMVDGHQVQCTGDARDQYGRLVATCRVGGIDVAANLVTFGFALALPEFSEAYVEAEERARVNKMGVWAGEFLSPAEWRKAHPKSEPPEPRPVAKTKQPVRPRSYRNQHGCAIKGNRSRRGDWIYHLPGQQYYEQTRPEELFCTEEEAIRAGYRRSKV